MKKLILCDLDKTLIDEKYKVNSPELKEILMQAQNDDFLIGLNSDTPIYTLNRFATQYGFKGPVIGELGGVITYNGRNYYFRKKRGLSDN